MRIDRKSTRLNSSHLGISYAVFCLKKNKKKHQTINSYQTVAETSLAHPTVTAARPASDSIRGLCSITVLYRFFLFLFFFFLMIRRPPKSTLFPYPPLFR